MDAMSMLIFGAPSSGQFPDAETPVPHSSRHNVCSLGAYVSWYLGEAVYLPLPPDERALGE